MVRTKGEIEHLKLTWLDDPCWDLESTEGFEEHAEELARFARVSRARWEAKRVQALFDHAERLGCPGNLALATYVANLEARIAALEAD